MRYHYKPLYLLLLALTITIGAFTLQMLPTVKQPVARAAASTRLNAIQQENLLPGTTSWQLTNPTPENYTNPTYDKGIQGYSSVTSAKAGNTVNFSVSTIASTFKADIYRLGWYQGKGARLMRSIANIPGKAYPVPAPNTQTGLVEAGWPAAFSVTIPSNWITGMYIVKLTDANKQQSYIPFTVKTTSNTDFAFIHSVNTDEAYNIWGGASLYGDFTNTLPAGRAFKVSFDRPFFQSNGAGNLLKWEYPMIRWLEKYGYNVGYISDVDVHLSSTTLLGHRGVLIVGHGEYWSGPMRDHLQTAVNSGVNLGSFGGNDIFWQIRYEPSSNGVANRVVVCYKDASLDPLYNKDNKQVTVNFRSLPLNVPEQTLLGSMYYSYFAESDGQGFPWVANNSSSWVFAGTGLQNGDSLPGLVGYEFDSFFPGYPSPATITGADGVSGVEILAASPVTDIYNAMTTANSTLYTAPSGARVFNVGSIQWSLGLDSYSPVPNSPNLVSSAAQQITANILHNFLTGLTTPATLMVIRTSPSVLRNLP
ncbi:MAG: N,N-dimethylformamidase beta subunit family domain-containing protein [Ktedonobacteraceae bacterium]